MFAAKWHKIKTTWPYFIPGIPIVGIPTFGAFIQSRSLTVNRDILFDIAVAGPIAGLVVAVVVVIFGAWTSPVIDSQVAEDLMMGSTLFPMNENLIMKGALALFDKDGTEVEVIMSPLMLQYGLIFNYIFESMSACTWMEVTCQESFWDKNGTSLQLMEVWAF